MVRINRSLFIGRFQPFHNGHLDAVERACMCCDELIIGVGSSQKSFEDKNPFTFTERYEMISSSIRHIDTPIIILPIPDMKDNVLWTDNVINMTPSFYTVCTGNKLVEKLFMHLGVVVDVLYRQAEFRSGTEIREFIKHKVPNSVLEQYVPEGSLNIINSLNRL